MKKYSFLKIFWVVQMFWLMGCTRYRIPIPDPCHPANPNVSVMVVQLPPTLEIDHCPQQAVPGNVP